MKTNLLEQQWRLDGKAMHTSEVRQSGLSINVNSLKDGRKLIEVWRETEMLAQISLDHDACRYLAQLLSAEAVTP